jgi:antagonist of KipI
MSILITRSGLLDTIQDEGRYGHQHIGINPGGAMDISAMHAANALLGNAPGEAILEMHFPAATIYFEEAALIALSGAEFSATINGIAIAILQPVWVTKNATLVFTKQVAGTRTYLAVQGGYRVNAWMDSYSTNLKVKGGGFEGRSLVKNDRIFLKEKQHTVLHGGSTGIIKFPWIANVSALYYTTPFRFIAGAAYEQLQAQSKQALEQQTFLIGIQSDRMGYRLQSKLLSLQVKTEMISTAVTKGTIQLLPDGQLIILMADHQTTGGYPMVGHITGSDFSSLAQLHAGEKFMLTKIEMGEAEQRMLQQQRDLQQLRNACTFRLQQYLLPS